MKCKTYQAKILSHVAYGESELPPEIREHLALCPACRQFRAANVDLLAAIDVSLRHLVHQPVAPRLYTIAAQLPEDVAEGNPGGTRLWLGGISAVTAVLLLTFLVLRNTSQHAPQVVPAEVVSNTNAVASPWRTEAPKASVTVVVIKNRKDANRPLQKSSDAFQDIIVLPEEREAYARFVSVLPRQEAVAIALARPAPPVPENPMDIGMLQVKDLEVEPLEGTPRD
jgi:hypothetical protein